MDFKFKALLTHIGILPPVSDENIETLKITQFIRLIFDLLKIQIQCA